MRRDLPPRPHIEHLKKQAKDLLDAYKHTDPEALDRIRSQLPAFAGRSREETAQAAFALHDAQSTIAGEYGFDSWRELRAEVATRQSMEVSDANMRALIESLATHLSIPFPNSLLKKLREASADRTQITRALLEPLPQVLPLIALRNTLLLRRTIAPFHLNRPASLAAIELSCQRASAALAVFAQHVESDEDVRFERLHRVGCQAFVHTWIRDGDGRVFVVLEALRTIELRSLEPCVRPGDALLARVSMFTTDEADAADELPRLDEKLRGYARQLAGTLPQPESARALIDALDEADLPEAVVQVLPCTIADKARFATEPKLVEKLRIAIALLEAQSIPQSG